MLDKTSLKIVIELCRDGSLSNAALAKKLGINVLTAAKKKKMLIDNGVIDITAMTNPAKMGYQVGALIGLDVDLKEIENVCTELTNKPIINLVITCFGRFDILITAYFYDLQSMQNFVKMELSQIKGVNRIQTFLMSDAKKQYRGLPIDGSIPGKPAQLDEIDKQIINELLKDSHAVNVQLARKLGLSQSTISRRIAFLEKQGVIFFRANINPSKLGYTANAFVLLRAELSKIEQICEALVSFPEVHLVIKLMNDYEILFGVHFHDPEKLYNFFKNRIMPIDGILKAETFIHGNFHHFRAASLFVPSLEQNVDD